MAAGNKQKRDIEPIMAISFVVFLLASVAVLSVFVYDNYIFAEDEVVIVPGSKVEVDYTGSIFGYYDEVGALIFDTSVKNHAEKESYNKVGNFTRTSFKPLEVTPGSGKALTLFENALIGKKVGDTVRVTILQGEGYISKNNTISETFSVEFVQYFEAKSFEEMYDLKIVNGVPPVEFQTIYGWDATAIYDTTKSMVKVENKPVDSEYTLKSNELNKGANAKMVVNSSGTNIDCTLSVESTGDYMVWVDLGYESFYIYGKEGSKLKITNDPAAEYDIYFVITIKSIE